MLTASSRLRVLPLGMVVAPFTFVTWLRIVSFESSPEFNEFSINISVQSPSYAACASLGSATGCLRYIQTCPFPLFICPLSTALPVARAPNAPPPAPASDTGQISTTVCVNLCVQIEFAILNPVPFRELLHIPIQSRLYLNRQPYWYGCPRFHSLECTGSRHSRYTFPFSRTWLGIVRSGVPPN